jgi:cytochrome P450
MRGDFDFFSDEFQHNPGATFTRMINECPVHKSAEHGWYSVFRYADIARILRDNETFSARFGPGPGYAPQDGAPVLVSADPPLHGKQKQAIVTAFNATTIAAMEGPIRSFVNECLDKVIGQGRCDVIQDIAVPIPLWVICRMLDLPYERDKAMLRDWVEVMAGAVFSNGRDELAAVRMQKMQLLMAYFGPHIAAKVAMDERGEDPGSDLIALLAKGRVDGKRISIAEMLGFAQFLLVAGSGTTTNLIGNFVKLMLAYPEQLARLRAHPELLDQAVEEVLRFEAPVHGLFRTNNEPIELGGHTLPKDTKICLMWGSANRDPELFDDPNTFDITRDLRTLRQNLTFGQGLHKCLGAPLARLECRVFAEEFLRRIPEFEADGEAVPYPYATLNGLDNLPIRFPPFPTGATNP